jgi:hypothetical protein
MHFLKIDIAFDSAKLYTELDFKLLHHDALS